MSDSETDYFVVLSNAGVPRAKDRVRILRRDLERTLVLNVLTQGKDPDDKAELSYQATLENGAQHFTGPSALGYQIDVTFHRNHLGEFIYGRTGPPGGGRGKPPGRGGTGVWVAEEEEAGKGGGGKRPRKK